MRDIAQEAMDYIQEQTEYTVPEEWMCWQEIANTPIWIRMYFEEVGKIKERELFYYCCDKKRKN